jgi:lipopolysaccharide transport system ATP-binding protein
MTVRLGFAIAAHLEPEILVVDEVLAVGDAEFQKKAIGKMQDVSHSQGRTVLFVSHNMVAIKSLCTKGIVLKNGSIEFTGNIEDCISSYLNQNTLSDFKPIKDVSRVKRNLGNQNAIKKVWIENQNRDPTSILLMG